MNAKFVLDLQKLDRNDLSQTIISTLDLKSFTQWVVNMFKTRDTFHIYFLDSHGVRVERETLRAPANS